MHRHYNGGQCRHGVDSGGEVWQRADGAVRERFFGARDLCTQQRHEDDHDGRISRWQLRYPLEDRIKCEPDSKAQGSETYAESDQGGVQKTKKCDGAVSSALRVTSILAIVE